MRFGLSIKGAVAATALALSTTVASAAVTTVGPGGYDNGYATRITYEDNNSIAKRGTNMDRDNPLNALGAPEDPDRFFEIGLNSFVELTFGTAFNSAVRVIEFTFGNRKPNGELLFDESIDVFASFKGGAFVFQGSISNEDAQKPGAVLGLTGGPFDKLRLVDTSPKPAGQRTGGFDIESVKVSAVPLPAGILLLGTALAGLGFARRRKAA